jgi:hypothetical protein
VWFTTLELTLNFALGGHSSGTDHGGSANGGEKGLGEHFRRLAVEYLNVRWKYIERKSTIS